MSILVVTGTDTEVGKTVVTAAVATLAAAAGQRVAVVKPAQTGVTVTDESDMDVVRRLSGVTDVHELIRYPDPLAPETAARRAGVPTMSVDDMSGRIIALAADRDLVLVEGAGGLLVHLDGDGRTLADLAEHLGAPILVVAAPGLGTLNAIALTCEAISRRHLTCTGIVFGSWPHSPDLAASENLRDAPAYAGAPLLGALPAEIGNEAPNRFRRVARDSLSPALGGTWAVEELSYAPR